MLTVVVSGTSIEVLEGPYPPGEQLLLGTLGVAPFATLGGAAARIQSQISGVNATTSGGDFSTLEPATVLDDQVLQVPSKSTGWLTATA